MLINDALNIVSERMRRVHSSGTLPESLFQKSLKSTGLRFKTNCSNLPGKPDIVIPSEKLAIFIDGDFWHGGQWQERDLLSLEEQFKTTKTREYWLSKIRRNMERDFNFTSLLISEGWTVLRFWESEINQNMICCLNVIRLALENRINTRSYSSLPQRTVAEFFAGIGLMRMGLENAGWSCAFANDIDVQKYEMYKDNFESVEKHFALGDIHKISVNEIPTVTLATASFPCTDLSLAGAREGLQGKQSSAFWGFVRVLDEMGCRRPPIIMLENVPAFLTSSNGGDFKQALLALNRLGYSVDAFIMDAINFVPQSRPRLFVVGIQEEMMCGKTVSSTSIAVNKLRPESLMEFVGGHPEIRWHLQPLPIPPNDHFDLKHVLEDIPRADKSWWNKERARYLLSQMSKKHREIADEMIRGKGWRYGTIFRRTRHGVSTAELRVDGIAGCLRTPKGGSARQILFKAGKGKYFARLITPREAARLMGADNYKINVSANKALFGFGDAVCVSVVEWIAKYYLNPLVSNLIRSTPLKSWGNDNGK
ncbi:MAG: DNA mismatch endonuclease Vsr [Candidatus Omnitrophota bacterium]